MARLRRITTVLVLGLLGGLALAGPARADTATISVNDIAGRPDPVSDLPRTFVVSGTSATKAYVYVKYRATGGAPCAPTAGSDSGEYAQAFASDYTVVNGAFSISGVGTQSEPGTYLFCTWVAEDSQTAVTPIAQTITFREPTGSITAAVSPTDPLINRDARITVSGASESPRKVYAKVRRNGGDRCAPTWASDTGDSIIWGAEVNGAFSLIPKVSQSEPGTYRVCLWLQDPNDEDQVVGGPQSITYRVVKTHVPASCRKARATRATAARKVAATKRQLLHARSKKSRRALARRLTVERRRLATATRKSKAACR